MFPFFPRRPRLSAALALALAGCSGGSSGDVPVEISAEDRRYGAAQHPRLLAEFGGAYEGEEAGYVSRVGDRVATAAGLQGQCAFTLVNSDVVNAFAVPGCYVYVTRGLLALVTSEAELASVLGHELGHVAGRHSQRQERRSLWRRIGVAVVSLTGSERLTRLAGQAAQYFTLRYSREQEYRADDLGLRYLRRAGYDPYAAPEMLAALARNERFVAETGGRDEGKSIPEWVSSHPLTANRIARARKRAVETGLADNALAEGRSAYLSEVDGLLYGDDPAQGFVLGRRFLHPLLRIGFTAPPGFTLTNSPNAVGITGPGGVRGEFGGGTMPRGGVTGYADALARAIVGNAGVNVEEAKETRVDGMPAALLRLGLQGHHGAAVLSIAAYDVGGGQAYHFLTIAPPDAPAAPLDALFGSFRALSAAEVELLRPRVVRTVVAGPGETVDRLARLMADEHGRALFLLLNGWERARPIKPGERVKLVRFADVARAPAGERAVLSGRDPWLEGAAR